MGDADEADVPAGPGRVQCLHHRLLRPDRLDNRVCAEPIGELLDLLDPFVAAFLDDVGCAELTCQALAVVVAAHRDDPLGAELLRREHSEQPDCTVADDRDGLAGAGFGGDGGEPASAEDSEAARRLGIRSSEGSSGVATRVPSASGTRSSSACAPSAPIATRLTQALWYPARQIGQVLSEAQNEPTTNWPGRTVATSAPTSSTMPTYSWPIGIGQASSSTPMPRYGQRSEPQTQARTMRTTASVGSRIDGSGTSSTRTSPGPYITVPRISDHSLPARVPVRTRRR